MTISSSLNAGVAGLSANATQLATISDNIANSATYGYKKAKNDFYSVVVGDGNAGSYSAGGVRSVTTRLIAEHGPLISSSNATDLAMDGRGFIPVTTIGAINDPTGTGGTLPVSMVTTGSFRPDQDGVLRTSAGQVLMGWKADANGNVPDMPRDSMSSLQPVVINTNQFVANPTDQMTLGVNLPATSTATGSSGAPYDLTVEYYGNLGTSESLHYTFTPAVAAAGNPSTNTWDMQITDSASNNAVVGQYTLTFDGSQATGGKLQSVSAVSGPAYDPTTGQIPLAVGGGTINVTLGKLEESGGMTQLGSNYAPAAVTKNGSPVASLTSVEVDQNGMMHAVYDQGFSKVIYQIPVVDVPNPNGLTAQNNQTYSISGSSGAAYLWNAGDGPTGGIAGYSQEQSSVDLAAELTQLITTQRAYDSNAKVIQTVDEMLQQTTNIKR